MDVTTASPSIYDGVGAVEIVREKVMRAGYVVRTERVTTDDNPPVTMRVAYTPDGSHIGDSRWAHRLVVRRGINPQLRTSTSNTCSIGYNARERKWYGWSHRAICGFKRGDVVKEGDCTADGLPVGFKAVTLLDCKRMAEAFAESVS